MDNENIKKDIEIIEEETVVEETTAEEVEADDAVETDINNAEDTVESEEADDETFVISDEEITEEELEEAESIVYEDGAEIAEELAEEDAEPVKKRKGALIGICIAVVVLIAAAVAATAFFMNANNDVKTIVNTSFTEEEGVSADTDNIVYENPIMAVINNFTDKKDAVAVINGKALEKEFYTVQVNSSAVNLMQSMLQMSLVADVSKFDWDEKAFETELSYKEYVKAMALNELVPAVAFIAEGEKRGIALTDEDKETLKKDVEEKYKKQYGDKFEEVLKINGFSGEESFMKAQEFNALLNKIVEDFNADPEKYISADELVAKEKTEKVRVKHILIAFDKENPQNQEISEEQKAAAKKRAEEVLEKVNKGEDFDALIEEYNDDPGMMQNPDGYTFADDGSMAPEFSKASFELEVGKNSGLVETSYGYHIIKRMDRMVTLSDYVEILTNCDVVVRKNNFLNTNITLDIAKLFEQPAE